MRQDVGEVSQSHENSSRKPRKYLRIKPNYTESGDIDMPRTLAKFCQIAAKRHMQTLTVSPVEEWYSKGERSGYKWGEFQYLTQLRGIPSDSKRGIKLEIPYRVIREGVPYGDSSFHTNGILTGIQTYLQLHQLSPQTLNVFRLASKDYSARETIVLQEDLRSKGARVFNIHSQFNTR